MASARLDRTEPAMITSAALTRKISDAGSISLKADRGAWRTEKSVHRGPAISGFKGSKQDQHDADGDRGVGYVEHRPGVPVVMHQDEVEHRPAPQPVDQVAHRARQDH